MTSKLRILGIDPGSLVAGFACLEATKDKPVVPTDFRIADVGVIRIKQKLELPERIGHLHDSVFQLVSELKPHACIIERAFYGVNANTTIRLGEARGAVISAARRMKIPIHEITPSQVKKTITGNGRASKEQVQQSIQMLMRLKTVSGPFDATDALAIALCYGLSHGHAGVMPERSGAAAADLT